MLRVFQQFEPVAAEPLTNKIQIYRGGHFHCGITGFDGDEPDLEFFQFLANHGLAARTNHAFNV
jgi:hypothetical protein